MSKADSVRARIGPVGPLVGLCATIAAAIVLNLFPQFVGTARLTGTTYTFEPALTSEFGWFLPGLNLWWAALVALNLAHLLLRRWTRITRLFDLGVRIAGAGIFLAMASVAGEIVVPSARASMQGVFALIGLVLVIRPLLQSLPGHHSERPVEI
jgi:hypothetical protein